MRPNLDLPAGAWVLGAAALALRAEVTQALGSSSLSQFTLSSVVQVQSGVVVPACCCVGLASALRAADVDSGGFRHQLVQLAIDCARPILPADTLPFGPDLHYPLAVICATF